ncbi:MAG: hypothetical protein COA44_07595 [Arcobacter sp.]|nr:MAG: hypothetical protein COA44_07595 [Arcobacter sp.]
MFSWLFNLFSLSIPIPNYNFGRFISYKKTSEQQDFYQLSKKAFSQQRYLEGYENYFKYLRFEDKDGNNHGNISFSRDKDSLEFKLIQGSAIIKGNITQRRLKASVNIAHTVKDNMAVMRRLLEKNYMYTYSSFFLEAETLRSKIYFDNASLSPQKVYFPLREIAINTDKEKELLLDEFNDLEPIELDHIVAMDPHLKDTKLRFFREWIDKTEQKVALLPTQEQSGAIAFVWLGLLLRIDYFVTPRGKLGFEIYEAIQEYYIDDNKLIEEKNDALQKATLKLKELDSQKLSKSLYPVQQTFDIFTINNLDEIRSFIDETLTKIIWYKEHKYEEVILTIYEYLALYMLYNFGMNDCLRELVQLNVRLHNTDFHSALGIQSLYKSEDKLDSSKINKEIKTIISSYNKLYPHLHNFSEGLNYESLEKFHHSYFNGIKSLNFSEL